MFSPRPNVRDANPVRAEQEARIGETDHSRDLPRKNHHETLRKTLSKERDKNYRTYEIQKRSETEKKAARRRIADAKSNEKRFRNKQGNVYIYRKTTEHEKSSGHKWESKRFH
ncbi:hypothetical protein P8452_66398 [Trifolium repens]|jgi:hypothetical protein|nr:hypothetical protein P8452_66398 [Trifolium repens]